MKHPVKCIQHTMFSLPDIYNIVIIIFVLTLVAASPFIHCCSQSVLSAKVVPMVDDEKIVNFLVYMKSCIYNII